MPAIYISPSERNWSSYVTGIGSEEFDMNLLVDQMIPYLQANAIRYARKAPGMATFSAITQANQGNYDLYLDLRSTTLGGEECQSYGITASYCPGCIQGQRAAELVADHLRSIYMFPNQVRAQACADFGEMSQPKSPAVLLGIGHFSKGGGTSWIEANLDTVAQQLVHALTDYFGLPFFYPLEKTARGTVAPNYGTVNLRDYPSAGGKVLAGIPAGAPVTVYGQWQDWYSARYENELGYLPAAYVEI